MSKKRDKKKKDRVRRSNAHKMTFARYVESDRSLDLPPVNASTEVLVEYLNRAGAMIEGHEDEVGSGVLAWRCGKVLNWLKERCDEGQLEIDGKKTTYVPHEFRTFSGETMIIRVHSIEEMEQLAKEKMQEHNLAGIGTTDDDEHTCPRAILFPPGRISLDDTSENPRVVAEIRVDSSIPPGKPRRDDPGESSA